MKIFLRSLSQRIIPALSDILAASEVLLPGDIPEDVFMPPSSAIYVAPASLGGNDANAGTSVGTPLEHLERAIQYANDHPDTPLAVYLREGVYLYKIEEDNRYQEIQRGNFYVTAYPNERVTIRPYYWPGNPSDYGGERAFILNGPYTNVTFANLNFEGWSIIFSLGCPYTTAPLQNVTLKNIQATQFSRRNGDSSYARLFLETAYLTNDVYGIGKVIFNHPELARYQIQNLLLSRIALDGVDLAVNVGDENDANIKGLRLSGLDVNNPNPDPNALEAADAIAVVNSYKVLIDDCTIQNFSSDGIDCKSYDVSIVNCLVHSTIRNAVKLWRNGEMINSIIYDCTAIDDGALVVNEGGPFRMLNSAILKKSAGYSGTLEYLGAQWLDPPRFQFINSIFAGLDHSINLGTSNFAARLCLFNDMPDGLFSGPFSIRTAAELNLLPGCSNNLEATPGLVNPAALDFRLGFGSACIDAGTGHGVRLPSFDYWGCPRVVGQAPDIGPIEYNGRTVDSDTDGMMDQDELRAGTNPLDPSDSLRLRVQLEGTSPPNCVLSWPSVHTRFYDLLMTTNLASAWQPVPHFTHLPGTGAILTVTPPPASYPVFYCVQAQPE